MVSMNDLNESNEPGISKDSIFLIVVSGVSTLILVTIIVCVIMNKIREQK
jgi:hypothetical protein